MLLTFKLLALSYLINHKKKEKHFDYITIFI